MGKIKVTLEFSGFKHTFEGDYSQIDDWVDLLKQMTYCKGHHPDAISDVFKEGNY